MGTVKLCPTYWTEKVNIDSFESYTINSTKVEIRKMRRETPDRINDRTSGKKIASVVYLKSGKVILVPTAAETIEKRMNEATYD